MEEIDLIWSLWIFFMKFEEIMNIEAYYEDE